MVESQDEINEELKECGDDLTNDDEECPTSSERDGTRTMSLNEVVCVVAAEKYATEERRCKLSVGRNSDMRARYWSYLFDNLHRAVDEIYCTCETDESIVECEVHHVYV